MATFLLRSAGFLCSLSLLSGVQAAPVIIDEFTTEQSVTGVVDGAGILGGERDAVVAGGHVLSIGGGAVTVTGPAEAAAGAAILYWDGDDNTTAVNLQLGAVDLTDGGSNDRFYLDVTGITGSAEYLLQVYSATDEFSQLNFTIDQTGYTQIEFNSMTTSVSAELADFTAVERIALRVILDVGETITLNPFFAGGDPLLFEDGFESE